MTANRRLARIFSGLFMAVTLLAAASAGAESINLPATGQINCYSTSGAQIPCRNTGQDGEFQAGVVWPVPRFTVVGTNGCAIQDNLTRLIWAQNTTAVAANDWLTVVKTVPSATYCGSTGWRAANANELESLVSAGTRNMYSWLGTVGFKMQNTAPYYFSSTFFQNGDTTNPRAWGFNPQDGSVLGGTGGDADMLISTQYNPWLVRSLSNEGNAPARVAQTGQTLCFYIGGDTASCAGTGQDGQFRKGAAWAVPRFADNGDGTVTDSFTGLMWSADAMTAGPDPSTTPSPTLCATATVKTWEEALDFVRVCLNSADDPYLGYRDWRLPNKNELASLVDKSMSNPALPSITPFTNPIDPATAYPDRAAGGHWSSTTALPVYAGSAAWITDMVFGEQIPYSHSGRLHVWPVRGNFWLLTPAVNNAGGSGWGTIAKSPAGVGCTTYTSQNPCPPDVWPDGAARYNYAKKVTLTAKPDKYSTFSGWTSDPADLCPRKGSCTVTMYSDVTVTANFVSQPTLVLTPTVRNLGRAKVGKTAAGTLTVVNRVTSGKQNLTIDSIELGGTDSDQFAIDTERDRCSGQTIGAGKSCSFRVLFQPDSAGIKSATVTVLSADDPSGTTNTSTLSGTALAP